MSSWSDGYVADVPYTSYAYREMAPAYLEFVAKLQGQRWAMPATGGTYCELGSGQGFGTALLAATNPHIHFWGFDFHPGQTAHAQRLATDAALTNVTFEDKSFEQLLALPDDALPMFDVIALHGIYSWVSAENRRRIVQFIARKLKPGGLVYNSYNAMPGWASAAPFQRIVREHANLHPGGSDQQIRGAFDFVRQLREGHAVFFTQDPGFGERLDRMTNHQADYLAHEYLNETWAAHYFLDVARDMETAKLHYAFSASISDNILPLSVPPKLVPVIAAIADTGMRETAKDYAIGKLFRRDVYLKGSEPLTPLEAELALRNSSFAKSNLRENFSASIQVAAGKANGDPVMYGAIADALEDGPKGFDELQALPAFAGKGPKPLAEALGMLLHSSYLHPVQPHGADGGAAARRLNRVIAARARFTDQLKFLAVPAIGSGIQVSYYEQLGYGVLADNPDATPAQLAEAIAPIIERNGTHPDVLTKSPQEKAAWHEHLRSQGQVLLERVLPLWRGLGITSPQTPLPQGEGLQHRPQSI